MYLIPKNWVVFQHYKDRAPPWIKLHRNLLNDRVFMRLPLASRALAPMLWLLASESKDGIFDASEEELVFRLYITSKECKDGLKPLINNGFFIVASSVLAECYQGARPEREAETEGETETETEGERPLQSLQKKSTARASRLPTDQVLTDQWFDFCKAERPELDAASTFAKFKDYWTAKPGKAGTKLDWSATWRNWVREEKAPRAAAKDDWRDVQRKRTLQAVPAIAAQQGHISATDFFDVEAKHVTAIALG
jgi:hypothetical protein